ncbi:aldo/keto reductase [Aureisphaera galaxeae]|uniref:aldo/keto reductase n=1 Tax=Aureisphaera galaxeae TaxID=1538023 RepID=UPI00234FEF39|nr:aldo/keto reductase [Aureisphaera galaxeae]MDC8004391.1 aldo/keto reductase [Aureisphaera galaxeae]
MKTLTFSNGDSFHAIGLGTWKATGDELKNALIDAIEAGYRHIDTAAVYGNEEEIGEVLSSLFAEGKLTREELFITSKLWNDSHHPESVAPALQDSLNKLQLDYLDLYLIHWPVAFKKGVGFPQTPDEYIPLEQLPIADTWKSMEQAKAQGLTRHIGVSNFSVKKLSNLVANSQEKPEMNQVEMHPLLQQPDLVDYCKEHGIHLTAYSPLGSGDRVDAMKADDEPNLFEIPALKNIADRHGVHPASVLINWHLTRDIAVIPKSTTKKNIVSNYGASKLQLDASDLAQIKALDRNYRFINGKFFEMPGSGYSNIYDQ